MGEAFLKIVADTLQCSSNDLSWSSTSETVPRWDSLNHWRIISMLEDRYNVEFTIDEAVEFNDLKHLFKILMTKLEQ